MCKASMPTFWWQCGVAQRSIAAQSAHQHRSKDKHGGKSCKPHKDLSLLITVERSVSAFLTWVPPHRPSLCGLM